MNYTDKDITVAIISNAKNKRLHEITLSCIESIKKTSDARIVIYESSDVKYSDETKKVDYFNYNMICNRAVNNSDTDLIVLANNDLLFMQGWTNLLKYVNAGFLVCSPISPGDARQERLKEFETGYICGRHFSGWCFLIHKKAWKDIGGFDEDFHFWCADNAIIEQLKAKEITPLIDPESKVKHLVSQTLITETNIDELTKQQVKRFNKKYNQNLFNAGT